MIDAAAINPTPETKESPTPFRCVLPDGNKYLSTKAGIEGPQSGGGVSIPPKAIIFDIGRVIVHLNLRRALEPFATALQDRMSPKRAEPISPKETWRFIQADPRWHDWQEGRMPALEWHEHLTARLGVSLNFRAFCDVWNSALEPQTILSDDLFARLSAPCRLGLLSNTDPIHVQYLENHYTFTRHFAARIYSCAVGMSKPSPAIYEEALRVLGVTADEALYIDDVEEFVAAARRLGLDAVRFEEPGQLTAELSRRGLPT
jgi:FMN phosphatase YigB (HAD superfamily)